MDRLFGIYVIQVSATGELGSVELVRRNDSTEINIDITFKQDRST